MANIIEKFQEFVLQQTPNEQLDLWYLLSAMRGPDHENDTYKQNTIAIRKVVWPKKSWTTIGYDFYFSARAWKSPRRGHFASHIKLALRVLKALGIETHIALEQDNTGDKIVLNNKKEVT